MSNRRKMVNKMRPTVANQRADVTGCPDLDAVNGYYCGSCNGYTMTIHAAQGVTPMLIVCRAKPDCMGRAQSMMYPDEETINKLNLGKPSHVWYLPGDEEFENLSLFDQEHVMKGGLLLAEIDYSA